MYESFFKFERPPFKLVADPSMLFASRSVREALGRFEYAIKTGKGITVMTGEVGTGKTTIVNRFLDKAGPELQTAYIFNPTLSGLQLLKTLADELSITSTNMAKIDLTRAIYEVLLRNRQAGRRTVVFVDEAQILSREALEELRLISNLETWQEKLLHIVLVGQPELLQKLESFNLRQLRQRVELFIQIQPMSPTETRHYIEHRLRLANPLREVGFTDGACELIHKLSAGIPRDINKICDASLLVAYVAETGTVTTKHVREAIRTIDADAISFSMRGRKPRLWRFWASAATLLTFFALMLAFDSSLISRLREGSPSWQQSESTNPVSNQHLDRRTSEPQRVSIPLVHLASFRALSQAREFASTLRIPEERVLYIQEAASRGEIWYRVLLGNFEDLDAARVYASGARAQGSHSYAEAVRVPQEGLRSVGGMERSGSRSVDDAGRSASRLGS